GQMARGRPGAKTAATTTRMRLQRQIPGMKPTGTICPRHRKAHYIIKFLKSCQSLGGIRQAAAPRRSGQAVDNFSRERVESRFGKMTPMNEFWQACVQRLEQELPPQQINAWIRPLVPLDYDEELAVLRIGAPNRFKLDWVRKNFSTRLESMASDWYSQAVQVQFELSAPVGRPAPAPAARPVPSSPAPAAGPAAGPAGASVAAPAVITPPQPAPVQAATEESIQDHSRLNRDLTFDNFVIGKANQLARA